MVKVRLGIFIIFFLNIMKRQLQLIEMHVYEIGCIRHVLFAQS